MSAIIKKLFRYKRIIAFNLSVLMSYIIIHFPVLNLSTAVFAASDDEEFQISVPKAAKTSFITSMSDLLDKYIPQMQGFGAVVLVIACIKLGVEIGSSAAFNNPQQRQEALKGLFWLIIAGIVVIHAREFVGIAVQS